MTTLRTECNPQAQFMRPLTNEIRDNSVNPNRRQNERHRRKDAKESHRKSLTTKRCRNNLIHCLRSRNDVLTVVALDHSSDCSEQSGRNVILITLVPNDYTCAANWQRIVGQRSESHV